MYLNIVGLSDFGIFETSAKLYSGYASLYCFIKLQATSCVLNSVLIPSMLLIFPNTSNTTTEYCLGRLWGFALRSHARAKMKTAPKTTYSPAILKNVKITPGMVCPNNTAMKFEKDITANGCDIVMEAHVTGLDVDKKVVTYTHKDKTYTKPYDILINTIPVPELLKFTSGLPPDYVAQIKRLRYTPVVGLCFGTKEFLDPFNYWVNIFKERIHVLYQHSLLIDKYQSKVSWCVRYGGSAEDMGKSDEEIKQLYLDVLQQYFPHMELNWCLVFREKYSEPIYDKDYLDYCPKYRTPVKGLYNAGIQVTFPKIRNMSTALESGLDVVKYIKEDME